MLNKLKKDSKGFTIIEVMIVLAIAGLIILVVLLAIPALQRNGRNTAIKNDAAAIAGGITEFASNNDGRSITKAGSNYDTPGSVVLSAGSATTEPSTAKVQGGTEVSFDNAGVAADPEPGEIMVRIGENCTAQVGKRSVALHYSIETTSGKKPQCLDA